MARTTGSESPEAQEKEADETTSTASGIDKSANDVVNEFVVLPNDSEVNEKMDHDGSNPQCEKKESEDLDANDERKTEPKSVSATILQTQKGAPVFYDDDSYEYRMRNPKRDRGLVGLANISLRCSKTGCLGKARLLKSTSVVPTGSHEHSPPIGMAEVREIRRSSRRVRKKRVAYSPPPEKRECPGDDDEEGEDESPEAKFDAKPPKLDELFQKATPTPNEEANRMNTLENVLINASSTPTPKVSQSACVSGSRTSKLQVEKMSSPSLATLNLMLNKISSANRENEDVEKKTAHLNWPSVVMSQKGSRLFYDVDSYEYRLYNSVRDSTLVGLKEIPLRCTKVRCRGSAVLRRDETVLAKKDHFPLHAAPFGRKETAVDDAKKKKTTMLQMSMAAEANRTLLKADNAIVRIPVPVTTTTTTTTSRKASQSQRSSSSSSASSTSSPSPAVISQRGGYIFYDAFDYEYRLRNPRRDAFRIGTTELSLRCAKPGCCANARLTLDEIVTHPESATGHSHLPVVGKRMKRQAMTKLKLDRMSGASTGEAVDNLHRELPPQAKSLLPSRTALARAAQRVAQQSSRLLSQSQSLVAIVNGSGDGVCRDVKPLVSSSMQPMQQVSSATATAVAVSANKKLNRILDEMSQEWQYFKRVDGRGKVQCKLCRKFFPVLPSGDATNLAEHLQNQHSIALDAMKSQDSGAGNGAFQPLLTSTPLKMEIEDSDGDGDENMNTVKVGNDVDIEDDENEDENLDDEEMDDVDYGGTEHEDEADAPDVATTKGNTVQKPSAKTKEDDWDQTTLMATAPTPSGVDLESLFKKHNSHPHWPDNSATRELTRLVIPKLYSADCSANNKAEVLADLVRQQTLLLLADGDDQKFDSYWESIIVAVAKSGKETNSK